MPRVGHDSLEAFVEELLVSLGADSEFVSEVATSLVMADLRGHSSHGVRQLASKYADEIEDGRIDPTAVPEIEREISGWTLVDGNRSFGQLVGRRAAEAAIENAREFGIGVAALKRTSHIGRVGEFAEQACESGMGFAAFVCNPGSAWVAPPGSTRRRFSTNPISIGVPTFDALEFPLVVDIATSQVANGKIKEYAASDDPLPKQWVVSDSGRDLTGASRYVADDEGALRPLGGATSGHKGFGLSVMSELLAANIADGTVSGMDDVIWGNHAVFYVVDFETITTRERAAERAAAMAEYVQRTEFSDAVSPGAAATGDMALLPGEPEHRAEQRHRTEGIPLSAADARSLAQLARDNGIAESIPGSLR